MIQKWKATVNADVFKSYENGVVSGAVSIIRVGVVIEAIDLTNGILEISSTAPLWTKRRWFDLVPATVVTSASSSPSASPSASPPPADTLLHTILIYESGKVVLDGRDY